MGFKGVEGGVPPSDTIWQVESLAINKEVNVYNLLIIGDIHNGWDGAARVASGLFEPVWARNGCGVEQQHGGEGSRVIGGDCGGMVQYL